MKKIILIILAFMLLIILSVAYQFLTMPVKWYDEQGSTIVKEIKKQFSIPIDGMSKQSGIYHNGWACLNWLQWEKGSHIYIYGVKNTLEQDKIINEIKRIINNRSFKNVKVTFYDKSKYKEQGQTETRLSSKIIRDVNIK
jgi:hypothetical protein